MARIGLAAVSAVVLATGCGDGGGVGGGFGGGGGGGGKEAWISQCARGGDDWKTCTCVADELERNLDPLAFREMTLSAQGKTEQARKVRDRMPVDRQVAAFPAALKAAGKCVAAALH
jgi:hypothetical protein